MHQQSLIEVELHRLQSNRFQPRRVFQEEELAELAQSIKLHGLLQPPLIAPYGADFEIIAGERRVTACRRLGIKKISAIIVDMSDAERLEAALIENVQRVDLNPIEVAIALKKMGDELKLDQETIAERVGKKRSTVSNYIRLLQLPEKMQEALAKGIVSVAHAKVILSCSSKALQEELFQSILKNGTTIKGCIKIIQERERVKSDPVVDPDVRAIIEELQRHLGTKVQIQKRDKIGGDVVISFYSLEDLERLLSLIKVESLCR